MNWNSFPVGDGGLNKSCYFKNTEIYENTYSWIELVTADIMGWSSFSFVLKLVYFSIANNAPN